MTKSDLVNEVKASMAKDLGRDVTKKEATSAVNAVIGKISECVEKGDNILLQPFGRFGVKFRKERKATNMHTGEAMVVPAKFVPHFAPTSALKDAVGALKAESVKAEA